MTTATATEKVTIYKGGMMGIVKTEAKLVEHGRSKYAQYSDAPFVYFIPKGKRNKSGYREGYKPFLLILKGWGHPDPASMFGTPDVSANGVMFAKSRYSSCDPRWETDFNRDFAEYLASGKAEIVADYRHTTATEVNESA